MLGQTGLFGGPFRPAAQRNDTRLRLPCRELRSSVVGRLHARARAPRPTPPALLATYSSRVFMVLYQRK